VWKPEKFQQEKEAPVKTRFKRTRKIFAGNHRGAGLNLVDTAQKAKVSQEEANSRGSIPDFPKTQR